MAIRNLILNLLLLIVLTISCDHQVSQNQNVVRNSGQQIRVKVTTPAGETLAGFEKLKIPTFFNVAAIDNNDNNLSALVLSSKLNKGKTVSVVPISLFSFEKDTTQLKYLVSVPDEVETNHIGNNYLTFMSMNNDLSQAIENWFKAQCGLTDCSDYNWTNPYQTLLELEAK